MIGFLLIVLALIVTHHLALLALRPRTSLSDPPFAATRHRCGAHGCFEAIASLPGDPALHLITRWDEA